MLNLLISLAAAAAAFGGFVALLGFGGAVAPGVILGVVVYVVLGRRVGKRLDAALPAIEKHTQKGRVDEAVRLLEALRPLARFQRTVGRVLDAQIGMLLYAQKHDLEGARPYLERAPARSWQARAMLAAYHCRKKRYDDMAQVFERTIRRNRKTSLLWAAYAWCEWRRGRRERAIAILAEAQRYLPKDEPLGRNLLRLGNGQKMKMNSYGFEWWALGLEPPPRDLAGPPGFPAAGRPRRA